MSRVAILNESAAILAKALDGRVVRKAEGPWLAQVACGDNVTIAIDVNGVIGGPEFFGCALLNSVFDTEVDLEGYGATVIEAYWALRRQIVQLIDDEFPEGVLLT